MKSLIDMKYLNNKINDQDIYINLQSIYSKILNPTGKKQCGNMLYSLPNDLYYIIYTRFSNGVLPYVNTMIGWEIEFTMIHMRDGVLFNKMIKEYLEPYTNLEELIITEQTNDFILKKYLHYQLNKITYKNIYYIKDTLFNIFASFEMRQIIQDFYMYAYDNDFIINSPNNKNLYGITRFGDFSKITIEKLNDINLIVDICTKLNEWIIFY